MTDSTDKTEQARYVPRNPDARLFALDTPPRAPLWNAHFTNRYLLPRAIEEQWFSFSSLPVIVRVPLFCMLTASAFRQAITAERVLDEEDRHTRMYLLWVYEAIEYDLKLGWYYNHPTYPSVKLHGRWAARVSKLGYHMERMANQESAWLRAHGQTVPHWEDVFEWDALTRGAWDAVRFNLTF